MGKRNHSKEQKEKNPAQNQRWILFRIFFSFFFFFLICRWQEDGIPSAQRILSLHVPRCPQPPGCQRLPDTRLHSPDATAPPSHRLTWPGGTFLHWSCSGSSQALRRWPEALGGMDLLVRGRSRWVFVSLGTSGDECSPHPQPRDEGHQLSVLGFRQCPLERESPFSASPQRP